MNMKLVIPGIVAVLAAGLSLTVPAVAYGPTVSVDEVLPMSAGPQTEQDRAVAKLGVDLERHGLSPESLRWLGSDGVAKYWASIENNRQVCLLAYIPGDDWVAGSTCTPLPDFYRSGIGLGVGQGQNDPARAIEAYLLPEDVNPEQLGISKAATVETGSQSGIGVTLVSVSPFDSELTVAEVTRDSGVVFRLTPLTGERS